MGPVFPLFGALEASDALIAHLGEDESNTIDSSDENFRAVLQDDGNLVVFRKVDRWQFWNSSTANVGVRTLVMQPDGLLVMKNAGGNVIRRANAQGDPGSKLELENDGQFVIKSSNGVHWSSGAGGVFV